MFIQTVEVFSNNKSAKLTYEQGKEKSKTLRERLIFFNRNLMVTHVISCIDIKIKQLGNCKIIATLDTGAQVDLLELYNVNDMLGAIGGKRALDSLDYGDSTVFIDADGIRVITRSKIKGGYIGRPKHCISIPWFLNLKNRLYIDDHRDWLVA